MEPKKDPFTQEMKTEEKNHQGKVNRKDYSVLEPNSLWTILNRAEDTGNFLL